MEKIKLSTNLIILDGIFCTYWGLGNTDNFNEQCSCDFNDGDSDIPPSLYWMYFDNKAYMARWSELVFELVEENFFVPIMGTLAVDFKLSNAGTWSPREYNFSHDVVNIDLEVDWDIFRAKVLEYLKVDGREEKFNTYLKKNYSSYDGFWSQTSDNIEDWKDAFDNMNTPEIGALLSFIADLEDYYSYFKDDVYSEWHERIGYYTKFLSQEGENLLENFLESPVHYYCGKDWQKELLERRVGSIVTIDKTIKKHYLDGIDETIEIFYTIMKEKEKSKCMYQSCTEDFDHTVKEYLRILVVQYHLQIDNQTPDLFENEKRN